jgi:hypothetical protein
VRAARRSRPGTASGGDQPATARMIVSFRAVVSFAVALSHDGRWQDSARRRWSACMVTQLQ